MTAAHVGSAPGRPPGLGFGLGFEARKTTGEAFLPGSTGEYGWAGNAGTLFWIDPQEDLLAIYMIQVGEDASLPAVPGMDPTPDVCGLKSP